MTGDRASRRLAKALLAFAVRVWQDTDMNRFVNRLALILVCLLPLPAVADPPKPDEPHMSQDSAANLGPPLSAAEFEAYAYGKTLTYGAGGQVWGQEEYLAGRQVVWAFTDQPCEYGTWTEEQTAAQAPMICFTYEDNPDTNCWQFFKGKSGLVALFIGEGNTSLAEVDQTSQPMQCPGPKVGV